LAQRLWPLADDLESRRQHVLFAQPMFPTGRQPNLDGRM